MKKLVIDFRKRGADVPHGAKCTNGAKIEMVDSFKFLDIKISPTILSWSNHVDDTGKKAHHHLHFIRVWHVFNDYYKFLHMHRRQIPNWLHHNFRLATARPKNKNWMEQHQIELNTGRCKVMHFVKSNSGWEFKINCREINNIDVEGAFGTIPWLPGNGA